MSQLEPRTGETLRVVLIETEGRGREARVEIDGRQLAVVDSVSSVERPARSGPVSGARLEVVAIPRLCARSEETEKRLEPEWGWRYRSCGEVVSTDPLRIDLGPFSAELALPGLAPLSVGEYLTIAIDRIILSGAPA